MSTWRNSTEGLRKRDLGATMGRLTLIIDSHIVGENVNIMAAREAKIWKYSDNPVIDSAIKLKPGMVEVRYCLLIITSRGIWGHKSVEDLIGPGVLSRNDVVLMSVRVIEGSLKEFWIFTLATSIRWWGVRDAGNFNGNEFPGRTEDLLAGINPFTSRNRRDLRREQFFRAQDLRQRNPSTRVDRLLDNTLEHEEPMSSVILEPCWEAQSPRDPGSALNLAEPVTIMQELWAPISSREVRRTYPSASIILHQHWMGLPPKKRTVEDSCTHPLHLTMDREDISSFGC